MESRFLCVYLWNWVSIYEDIHSQFWTSPFRLCFCIGIFITSEWSERNIFLDTGFIRDLEDHGILYRGLEFFRLKFGHRNSWNFYTISRSKFSEFDFQKSWLQWKINWKLYFFWCLANHENMKQTFIVYVHRRYKLSWRW